MNQSLGTYIDLLLRRNDNVEELDYGPTRAPNVVTDRCEIYGDDEDCEDEEGDDESDGDRDAQAGGHVSSFLTLNQVMKNEKRRYVPMYVDVEGCDVSNNPDHEDLVNSSTVQYHLAPSPQFEIVFGNVVSSD